MGVTMNITELRIEKLNDDDLSLILKRSGYKSYKQALDRTHQPTHIYVWPKGETILENLEKRHQRPYTIYKKEVIPNVLRQMGLPSYTKVRWNQKAGCGCGCSPAFIVNTDWGSDVHVTIE
jgi:hypothetical protein